MSVVVPNPAALRRALLRWYGLHRRDLPWRRTRDPYAIWVSEIMLQQTRVAAVLDKYRTFLQAFPNVQSLATAHLDSVLARWSGLGYYRRARNLHLAANVIVDELGGAFPKTAEGWKELPGIGRYTAAAIASIAFDQAIAVVDGNVERVTERLIKQKLKNTQVWALAQDLLDPGHPGDWNQAMMELGATVCTPTQPQCGACPLKRWCCSRGDRVPRVRQARQRADLWYALCQRADAVLLVRRPQAEARMAGMWELPGTTVRPRSSASVLYRLSHSITDTHYKVFVIPGRTSKKGSWIPFSRLQELPLTGLTLKILRRHGIPLGIATPH